MEMVVADCTSSLLIVLNSWITWLTDNWLTWSLRLTLHSESAAQQFLDWKDSPTKRHDVLSSTLNHDQSVTLPTLYHSFYSTMLVNVKIPCTDNHLITLMSVYSDTFEKAWQCITGSFMARNFDMLLLIFFCLEEIKLEKWLATAYSMLITNNCEMNIYALDFGFWNLYKYASQKQVLVKLEWLSTQY